MELLFPSLLMLLTLLVITLIFINKSKQPFKRKLKQAPGPWSLPIAGSIHHLLFSRGLFHQTLRDLSAIYGPIMSLRLGQIPAVVISSTEAAKEIMKTHDTTFASRPIYSSAAAIFYNGQNIAFSPYGEFWRNMRRLCTTELLTAKRIRSFLDLREEEVLRLLRAVEASSGTVVNLSAKLGTVSNDIMARAVIGSNCEEQKLFLSALGDAISVLNGFNAVDMFPSMPKFVSRVLGLRRKMERSAQNLDLNAAKILEEHREKRSKDQILMQEDLTDVLLRIQMDGELQFPISNDSIKAVINDMLMAGSESTSTTIEWAMSEIVRNQSIMKKVQTEVREALSNGQNSEMIIDEVISKLSYLQLVIKETLRLHPPAPLLLPRENQESCVVLGYEIPAKTTVLVNMWALARDPKYWDEPDTFWPERFKDNQLDFKGNNLEYIPFGAGRRICPGLQFGLANVALILTRLLYHFDWELLAEKGRTDLNMEEAAGLTTRRKTPLCLLAIPRIPFLAA